MPSAVRRLVCILVIAGVGAFIRGADASQQSQSGIEQRQEDPAERPTFKTSATLVTVDAVVTDKEGRHVTDLTADDFEVVHAGKRQPLRHAVYVSSASQPVRTPEGPEQPVRAAVPDTPPGTLSAAIRRPPALVRRTIAIVVDDLGLSFESTANVRRALRRFVDERVEAGDLVAIVRTSGGIGSLQQFTTDKRLLHAAVNRVRWTIASRAGVAAFAPVEPRDRFKVSNDPTRSDVRPSRSAGERELGASYAEDLSLDGIRHAVLAAGSLGALDFVVRGVQDLPGRKAVVFVSEGFDLFDRRGQAQIYSAFTRLMDHANRAGVVVYTMNGRGLETSGLTAEDNPQLGIAMPGDSNDGDRRLRELILGAQDERQALRRNMEEALHYLAWQTGGFAVLNNNDLAAGLASIQDDLRGYYLLGYEAPPGAARRWNPDGIRVRVTRPGLRVRSRRGFFGPADPQQEPSSRSGDPLLMAAMTPFAASAIMVRLTSLFGYEREGGPYVRSLLFLDPAGLTFTADGSGRHVADAEIAQFAVGDNGEIVGDWRRRLTLSLTDDQLREARTTGVLYSTRMSVKEPGGYQVRTAVRDVPSGAVGSASQFLEVPRVGPGRLALSGLLLRSMADGPLPDEDRLDVMDAASAVRVDVLGRPSLRIFRAGSEVTFAYEIYDGTDPSDPMVATASLLRDGQVVFRGALEPVARPKDPRSRLRTIAVGGTLSLGEQVPPGVYTLEVNVASGRKRQAAQWTDLEVRR